MDSKPNMMEFRKIAGSKFISILQSVSGKKDLFIEPNLMRSLDQIIGVSILKENGVDKIYKCEPTVAPGAVNDRRIYVVRSTVSSANIVANHINMIVNGESRKIIYRVIFVPRMLAICSRILERTGAYGYATYDDFQFDFLPIDKDLLSMEIPDFFPSYFLHGDLTYLHTAAQALVSLQQMFSLIPNVYAIGKCANLVKELMVRLLDAEGRPRVSPGGIGHLFLVDRNTDYVTPLCTQLVYEGLLDDIFNITCGSIDLGPDVTGTQESVRLQLNSQDPIYVQIRDEHFSRIHVVLKSKTQNLQTMFNKGKNSGNVGEMKEFVSKELGRLKQEQRSLALHLSASEAIIKKTRGNFEEVLQTEQGILDGSDSKESIAFIEQHIAEQADARQSLRLMCLLSLTLGGLPAPIYQSLTTQYLQAYGFEQLPLLMSLKRLGMWSDVEAQNLLSKVARSTSQFRALCKKLNITPKTINLENPSDSSYIFNGTYAPLICKIVEQVLAREGFTGLDELVRLLPDPCKYESQSPSARERPQGTTASVLVFFLGGCSYSEVASLRFLARTKGLNVVVATTSLINGKSLIQLSEHIQAV